MAAAAPRLADLAPMEFGRLDRPFVDPAWIFEVKYDGYRMLAEVSSDGVSLQTRRGADSTGWFPELHSPLRAIGGGRHVLDGEVCVLDELGRSDFDALQNRARRRGWRAGSTPVAFLVFDVLVMAGRSVMQRPLWSRKALLEELIPAPQPGLLRISHVAGDGDWLFERVLALQLEGMVAKRLDSFYLPGERSVAWLKIKRKGAVPP